MHLNSFFDTAIYFSRYTFEHYAVLGGFLVIACAIIWWLRPKDEEYQRKIMLGISVVLAVAQLSRIPLNLYTGTFDVANDIPLHLCNFLPFVMIWVYSKKSTVVWATSFFWVILGVSQANFTPTVLYSLFHYDAIRYWLVHLGLVLLGIYPAIQWKWNLELKDVARTFVTFNGIALFIYGINLVLNSNYLYVMGKPPGTTFLSMLPEWPYYILVVEVIIIVWSLLVYGVFVLFKRRSIAIEAVKDT